MQLKMEVREAQAPTLRVLEVQGGFSSKAAKVLALPDFGKVDLVMAIKIDNGQHGHYINMHLFLTLTTWSVSMTWVIM